MAVYYIGSYDVTDPQSYDEYVKGVIPLLMKHGCEIIVADREAQKIEGASRNINLVLKFDNQEQAMAWYNDPDYQPVKGIRLSSTSNSTAVLAKAFQLPE
ncbi:MAG: DUF1330 domain-containing protein [Roseivirga sp.]|nr:DUF1330 domain-containing protein [Roseivirga sp.]